MRPSPLTAAVPSGLLQPPVSKSDLIVRLVSDSGLVLMHMGEDVREAGHEVVENGSTRKRSVELTTDKATSGGVNPELEARPLYRQPRREPGAQR